MSTLVVLPMLLIFQYFPRCCLKSSIGLLIDDQLIVYLIPNPINGCKTGADSHHYETSHKMPGGGAVGWCPVPENPNTYMSTACTVRKLVSGAYYQDNIAAGCITTFSILISPVCLYLQYPTEINQ